MGLEAECSVSFDGRTSFGKVHLDNKILSFRGDFKLDLSLAEVQKAEARKGLLEVGLRDGGSATFELGTASEKWALKIRYPRTLIDKLGVKEDMLVSVVGVDDADFWKHLRARTSRIGEARLEKSSEIIFFGIEKSDDLDRLPELERHIVSNGCLWVIWRKGRKELNQMHVMAASKAVRLVDVKVVSFSETHSGLKIMIPKARR